MHLRRIHFRNFRCFADQELELEPDLTLLFGLNGSGKSTMVDALATGLSPVIPGATRGPELETTDRRLQFQGAGGSWVRKRTPDVALTLEVQQENSVFSWTYQRTEDRKPQLEAQTGNFKAYIDDLADNREPLPVFAVYSAHRKWADVAPFDFANEAYGGYEGCLASGTDLSPLRSWWRNQDHRRDRNINVPALDAAEQAIVQTMNGDSELPTWDVGIAEDIMIDIPGQGRFALRELSDGQRGIVALVADIARRAALLHPQPDNELLTYATGVVVIDEIDLHLHPEWQRRVIPDLQRIFPKIQFIITTHSPQVLASAQNHQVRRLSEDFRFTQDLPKSRGRDSNTVLQNLMNTAARPPEYQPKLEKAARLVDDENFDQARQILDHLIEDLGEDDPDIISIQQTIALLEP